MTAYSRPEPETIVITLYCPACGYNLTGLQDNRCPECGKHFDVDDLLARAEGRHPDSAKPITLRETLLRLILLPGIFLLSLGLAAATGGGALPLAALSGAALVLGGIFMAVHLARRLAVSGAAMDGDRRRVRGAWFIPCCALGLYCCQLGIACGPCTAIFLYSL